MSRAILKRLLLPLLLSGLMMATSRGWATQGGQAEESGLPEIAGVQVGLGGFYRAGTWTPVRVTLRGGAQAASGQLHLTVPDGDGVPSRVSMPDNTPCVVPAGESRTVELYVRFGRLRSRLDVEFQTDQGSVRRSFDAADQPGEDQFPAAVENHRKLVVAVAAGPVGVEDSFNMLRLPPKDQAVVGRLEDAGQLPSRWYGYEGIDALVLTTSQIRPYADLKPDSPQLAALEQWIQMGGRLILCVGREGKAMLGDGASLAPFAPGRFLKVLQRRTGAATAAALEAYAGSSIPVPRAAGVRDEMFVSQLTDVKGTVEARDANLPLVVRQARGFGQVLFLAVDPELAPFDQWPERGLLMGKLLDNPSSAAQDMGESRSILHYGYTDLAGQMRSALDQFPSMGLVPFWAVVALIGIYIFLIGPGDYLFLRNVLRRMRWTWLTFPLVVVLFAVGAYWLAHWTKGSETHLNQVDLVDCDIASGRIRGTSWSSLFSPRTDRYNLAFRPLLPNGKPNQEARVLTGWLGLPGSALGGMAPDPRTPSPELWKEHYEFSDPLDAMSGVPIQVWATKSLTARWTGRVDVAQSNLAPQSQLVQEDRILMGTITNTLDFPLADCILAFDRWGYELGTLKPGQSAQLGTLARRRELETLLTGRKLESTESGVDKYRIDPKPLYDQSSDDPATILRAMAFFDAAGGRRFTGLFNEYQAFVDLSARLKTGSAILLARVPTEGDASLDGAPAPRRCGSQLLRDGKTLSAAGDRHDTFYRFIFPVRIETRTVEYQVPKTISPP